MSSQDDQLAALLLRWEELWEHGDDVPATQLCADLPDLADPLQRKIDALKRMAWMKKDVTVEAEANSHEAPLVGKTLAGRYRIDQFIGEGGFGQVYRAFDAELQRHVAVKVAHQQAQTCDTDLLREARRVAQLRHPGIVAVHDVGHDDKTMFVISDFIDGENLAQRLQSQPPTPWEAARLAAQIADALHFAHEQGFVHRDIKPANILIDKAGQPLIADFGIATTGEEPGNPSTGTLPYMAPEQLAGEVQLIDGRTDVYALGVVLYEMLAGQPPHNARTPTALREQILFRPPALFEAPAELQRICLRCLAKHPADRYPSAQAAAEALREALARHSRIRRWRVPLVLLSAAVVIAAVMTGLHFLPPLAGKTAFVKDRVFVFDGTNRIVTPLERFAPVTLEAWVRPERYEYRNHCIIGSDIPSEWGLSLTISGVVLMAEYIPGELRSKQPVPVREWSHVAAVFDEKETRLYFNGKLVATGPPTQIKGGTRFVVGNVGENEPVDYFLGQIRSVRISKGERYIADFVPDKEFVKDTKDAACKAVLIYGRGAMDGDKVIDLSGNGNDGVPERLPQ